MEEKGNPNESSDKINKCFVFTSRRGENLNYFLAEILLFLAGKKTK